MSKAQDIKIADRWSPKHDDDDDDDEDCQKYCDKNYKIPLICRESFEDDFEDIKDLISAKTLFAVDDAITQVIHLMILYG